MSEPWKSTTIRQCLVESFAGEWGSDPKPGNAKVLRATDIDDDGHVVGPGAVRQLPIGKLTSKRLLDGDILLEGSGGGPGKPVGRVAYFKANDHHEVAVCSNFFKTLRPKRSEVEPRFLLRKLAWFYKQPALLTFQQQTTGIINLKFEEYLSAQIEIPEAIIEQEKLAQVLDTLDTTIHETEAIIGKLKAVKQGLLDDLLTRGVDANGELRLPYAEAPHLYKESPLGWIPKEWDVVTLESVSKLVTSGSRDWARFYADSGALFVRIGNLTREHINFRYESTIYVRPPRNADGQRTRLESGDILISITADLGIIGVVPDGLSEAYINQHIALVRPDLNVVDSRFVGHYLAGPIAQTYLSKLNDGGAKAGLNLPTIRGLVTTKPHRAEQNMIATRLDEIDNRIQNAMTESAKLQHLKDGLMDDLLTGRVRVTSLLSDALNHEGNA
ncbi:restriction endonuclease subunit S [Pseudomonas sp. FP818]|uniref:restriction endonuclease subunit S n=1 Tax=Pseudomonas sp. FP818 TaxID=2954099 RepID=UPI0027375A34|nr:restriction endonuclease subunit S [Pseudomonas sp. FP818]WLI35446.1 restriction endonuclease subunit S [Pseudomonas sp. FP818]